MCANVVINDQLIAEAFHYAPQVMSKRGLIDLVLREFVERHGHHEVRKLKGKVKIHPKYDYKSLRENRRK